MAGFVNPIGPGLHPGRVDMGVDYTGSGPLYALGSGVVTSTTNSGWPGGKFVAIKLDSGQYVYYAENIIPHVSVGQRVSAGQLVATAVGTYPFVEVGWAAPPGTGDTMATQSRQSALGASQGDPGKYPTGYGVSMSNLIKSLGGPGGIVSGPVQGSAPSVAGSNIGGVINAATGATMGGGCLISLVLIPWWLVRHALFRKT